MKKGELLSAAIVFASNAHFGQVDKAGKPYILHPLSVMGLLDTDDEELQCIAVLHDVIEDCKGVTYKQLLTEGFTQRIVDGVRCLTKVVGEDLDDYKEKVFSNTDAMKVKKADLRHNSDFTRLQGITPKDIARMEKYQKFYWEIEMKLQELASKRTVHKCCSCAREAKINIEQTGAFPNVIEQ